MSLTVIFIFVFALGIIISGIVLLKQSATKFNLSKKQLDDIKARNKSIDKEEADD